MKWFRAQIANGSEKVDFEKGIIYGVAVNTEGEAKGHGVNLDKDFVEDVTRLGNEKKTGLKARFGHPNMSSQAMGTYIGRFKNFRTTYNEAGQAISRADLHLSESAKVAPGGNLFDYVLSMADKEPDMFGTSIVFEPKKEAFYFDDDNNKIHVGSVYDVPKNKKAFIKINKLHANDVVDEPAANPEGLFSAFCADQPAAKITAFLDENPAIFELFNNDEIRESFLNKYESYKKNKIEVDTMPEDKKELKASKGLFEKMFSFLQEKGFFAKLEEAGETTDDQDESETTDDQDEGETTDDQDESETTNDQDESETADHQEESEEENELSAKVENLISQLSAKEEKINSLEIKLEEANGKLSALGGGLNNDDEEVLDLTTFSDWETAIAYQMDEKGMSSRDAFSFCEKHYMDLYPA